MEFFGCTRRKLGGSAQVISTGVEPDETGAAVVGFGPGASGVLALPPFS
jgi:hypothetical protein